MKKCPLCEEIEHVLHEQRHDFLNHLQIVHALVEIGKTGRALQYIEDLAQGTELLVPTIVRPPQCDGCKAYVQKTVK